MKILKIEENRGKKANKWGVELLRSHLTVNGGTKVSLNIAACNIVCLHKTFGGWKTKLAYKVISSMTRQGLKDTVSSDIDHFRVKKLNQHFL